MKNAISYLSRFLFREKKVSYPMQEDRLRVESNNSIEYKPRFDANNETARDVQSWSYSVAAVLGSCAIAYIESNTTFTNAVIHAIKQVPTLIHFIGLMF